VKNSVCRGDSIPVSPDGDEFVQSETAAGRGEWASMNEMSLQDCQHLCTKLGKSWGCKFISYAPAFQWCYVHQECPNHDNNDAYGIYEYLGKAASTTTTSTMAAEEASTTTAAEDVP